MTAEELRSLFRYEPSSGELCWLVKRGNSGAMAGDVAGHIDSNGYRIVKLSGKNYKAHRLAWLITHGALPAGVIDHINGVKSDNRLSNLRDISAQANWQNQRLPSANNRSGFLGVSFKQQATRQAWAATIRYAGRKHHLGYFASPEEAHQVYLTAKRQHQEGCTI